MTGRHTLVFGWLAVLASANLHASSVVREKEWQLVSGSTFRNYVERQHFSLRLEFGGDGRIAVRKAFLGPHSQEDLLCEDKPPDGSFDFLAQARFDLGFVEECLSEEMPGLNIDAIYDESLRNVQKHLDDLDLTSRYDLTRADLVRLESWAQAYLSRLLKKGELPDFLVGAWKRHSSNRSECYEAKVRVFSDARNVKSHAPCDRWQRIIGATRFCGPDPANLIYFTPLFHDSAEQRAVASLDRLGLRECLGNLLTQAREPSMVAVFDSFGYSLPWSQQERLNDYAWEVWRSFHVEEWLENTVRAGAVPIEVELALNECLHGAPRFGVRSPPVMSQPDVQRRIPPPGWGAWEWEQREPSPAEALLETRQTQFMAYAGGFWVSDVTMGADGNPRVAPAFNGPHDDADLFCQPSQRKDVQAFLATARIDLPIVLDCLRADIPALDVDALHRKATVDAESTLKEDPRTQAVGHPMPELLTLQSGADTRIANALEKSGLYDFLAAAFRRHVGADSECYRAAMLEFERRKRMFFADGGMCEAPEQLISLMPSMKPDLLNYVEFNLHSIAAGPTQDAIEKLQEPGLRRCLGQILEQAGDRDTMGKLGMLQQYPRLFQNDRAVRYAWGLWRKHGLEEWIQRTSEAGRVPRHIRAAIRNCAVGRIPDPVPSSRDH